MDTYLVTPENVALLFGQNEEVDPRRAVADSLRRSGLPAWKRFEAESFSWRDRTLVLARPLPPCRRRVKR